MRILGKAFLSSVAAAPILVSGRLLLSAVMLISLTSCQKERQSLSLTKDASSNAVILARLVPTGTKLVVAEKSMMNAGFTCQIHRNSRLYTEKYGFSLDGPKLDFLACGRSDKRCDGHQGDYYNQAFLILDDHDQVKDMVVLCEPTW
jgi:hypothetical protein